MEKAKKIYYNEKDKSKLLAVRSVADNLKISFKDDCKQTTSKLKFAKNFFKEINIIL